MFGTNMIAPPKMLSYETALSTWESIKPIRGRSDTDTRPLARRGNDNLTIRRNSNNGDVIVTLYSTEIITYHTDGLITIEPYASALTNRIMWCILGPYMNTLWSARDYRTCDFITEVGGRYYNTPSYFVVDPRKTPWVLGAGSKPFRVPRLDRSKAAKALRESGYRDFVVWLETQLKLGVDPRNPDSWAHYQLPLPFAVARLLRNGDNEGWAKLAQYFSTRSSRDSLYQRLRHCVYDYEGCCEVEETAYFESWREVQSAMRRMKTYG